MPVKRQKAAAAKPKRRDDEDALDIAVKELAKGNVDRRELNALILADLAIPGGPSEKY